MRTVPTSSLTSRMTDIRIVPYNPLEPGNAPRRSLKEWDRFKEPIHELHSQGFTRKDILRILKEEYRFTPTQVIICCTNSVN